MPSELDPLLPHDDPAPEISGYGFSKHRNRKDDDIVNSGSAGEKLDEDIDDSTSGRPFRTIFGIFFFVVGLAFVITLFVPGGFLRKWDTPQASDSRNEARVNRILEKNPLIDGHNDLAIMIRYLYYNRIYDPEFTNPFEKGGLKFHVDLPRLKAGKVGGSFWSAYVGCPSNGTDFSDENYAPAVATTLSQIDLLRRLSNSYPKIFSTSDLNSSSATEAFENDRLLISPLAIEGLHQIGNSLANLRLYHTLGVRYATLTHNCHNAFADAALVTNSSGHLIAAPPFWGGISKRGQVLVREMNRIGMLVDISHVSRNTMVDILNGRPEKWSGSRAPVMFSHSSAYALCPHPRNVPDDVLELVKRTNSIVMVNFSPDFVSCTASDSTTGIPDFFPANSTLHQVARHIKYIGDQIGFEHVGLGSDFDGIFDTPKGLEDVSKYPDLVAELLHMGITDEDAAKVVGRNILRVWHDVDKVAASMEEEGVHPAEDDIEKLPFKDLM